jgi:hypothetical protein
MSLRVRLYLMNSRIWYSSLLRERITRYPVLCRLEKGINGWFRARHLRMQKEAGVKGLNDKWL